MPVYVLTFSISLVFAYISAAMAKPPLDMAISGPRLRDGRLVITSASLTSGLFAFLSFLPLYLISAFRYMVGTDYAGTYRAIYNYTYADGWHFKLTGETLYGLLNSIASIYSGADYVGVFALSSLLICGFIFLALKKQSVNFPYSVLLFIITGFYFWSFNAVRQMIAMAVFVYAFQYIEKKQPLKYFLLIIFAAGFHTTALLYLPVYFINKVKLGYKSVFVLSAVFLLVPSIFTKLAYVIASKISILNVYVLRYLDNSRFDSYTESSSAHLFINLAFMLLYIVIAKLYDKNREKSNIWITLQFLAFAFASLSNVLPLANRLSRLFAIMQILSIPYMTRLITDSKIRLLVNLAIIVCYTAYCFVTFYILGYHNVFPYQTIFSR